jgi:hypothetical protein
LTLFSPKFLANRMATYEMLHQGGYTNLVVYLAQQVHQFRLRGQEFAMQHLGTEDELKQVLYDLWDTLTPEEKLEHLSREEALPLIGKLLARAPLEQRLVGLSQEERERLLELLRQPATEQGGSASPGGQG